MTRTPALDSSRMASLSCLVILWPPCYLVFPICLWSTPVEDAFVSVFTFQQRETRYPSTGSDPMHCSRFQRKSTSKPAGKSAGGKSIAAQSVSAIYTPKRPGKGRHLTKQTSQARPTSAVNLLQSLSPITGHEECVSSQHCSWRSVASGDYFCKWALDCRCWFGIFKWVMYLFNSRLK